MKAKIRVKGVEMINININIYIIYAFLHILFAVLSTSISFDAKLIVRNFLDEYLPTPDYFSLREDFHKPNGFLKGGICIAVMSCNRTSYLIRTLTALLSYIQKYEPDLNYNLVWVDSASQNQDLLNLELNKRFHFDRRVLIPSLARKKVFEGITTAYKFAINLCEHSEFFLPLEDDWELISTPRIGFINLSMELLNISPYKLIGFIFKDTEKREGIERSLILEYNKEKFNVTCRSKSFMQYMNGAAIYKMTNIKRLVRKGIDKRIMFEYSIDYWAKSMDMYSGYIDLVENCTKPVGDCYGVFHHIGKKSTWMKS